MECIQEASRLRSDQRVSATLHSDFFTEINMTRTQDSSHIELILLNMPNKDSYHTIIPNPRATRKLERQQ